VFHPSVLRIIKYIIENAKKAGIEAGMCGEAAGNPCMIPLLLSFGLDEFSVSPSNVLETRKNIALWSIREADEVTTSVMAMCTEKEVANYLSDYIAAKEQRSGFALQNKEDKSSAPARAVAFASQTRRI
jgi:phosphotransferase system enzyme I (PtsI)